MKDVRQSRMYVQYMRRIGWIVDEVDGVNIFIKRLPLIGSFIKIQRPERVPSLELINELAREHRAWRVSLEPKLEVRSEKLEISGFKINNNPYLPTKTIRIDLTGSEEEIFKRFTEAKRRAVRRAVKNEIIIKESNGAEEFIKLKSKDFWPLGWLMVKDVQVLWETFRPNGALVLTAYYVTRKYYSRPVAGILLLLHDRIAYYWMAASTNEGKKLFAPTLLVSEALKLAKKKGCKTFDFEGIYDERFDRATRKWQGFTKFKEGFGGKEISFPNPLNKSYVFGH